MKIILCLLTVITLTLIVMLYEDTSVAPLSHNTIGNTQEELATVEVINGETEQMAIIEPEITEAMDEDPDAHVVTASKQEQHKVELPGEDVEFKLQLNTSSFHDVNGKATSTIGETSYTSRLLPSNEVELELVLKQEESDAKIMKAHFDLANYEMELDGGDAVLNEDHKQLMKIAADHLRHHFMQQYEGLDVPEHAFMLVQMLSYWSMAPDGFVYEKRIVQSR